MDSLGSLALATEPPKIDLLNRPPHGRNEYIISRRMVKHILGMFIYQIIIIYSIVFAGEFFFPEPEIHYRYDRPNIPYVYPGRVTDWDGSALWSKYEKTEGESRHLTNAFNVFVVLQIFNMINVRKINDEFNIFDGLFDNYVFVIIWFIIVGGQVIIVCLTGDVFKVAKNGIHYSHWIIAIVLGFSTWLIRFALIWVPITWCPQLGQK